ncbi:DUF2798 domain-containing protein [Desulfitobacterium chlororespirans]|uniref:DUF2798 domain-containing protein n=1 Tax=Desulfitobacterium chlororespirans TaxID=51616 RepID=UPI000933F438|nr:DUF2798 domain-containing protein [Desulfitobacterium chlororespirans]
MAVQENAIEKPNSYLNKRALFMSIGMALTFSMVMSFVMTIVNIGFTGGFWIVWLSRWPVGFLTALPLSFFLPRFFARLADKLKL